MEQEILKILSYYVGPILIGIGALSMLVAATMFKSQKLFIFGIVTLVIGIIIFVTAMTLAIRKDDFRKGM